MIDNWMLKLIDFINFHQLILIQPNLLSNHSSISQMTQAMKSKNFPVERNKRKISSRAEIKLNESGIWLRIENYVVKLSSSILNFFAIFDKKFFSGLINFSVAANMSGERQ